MGDDRRCGRRKEKESCGGLVCGGRGGRLREGRPGVLMVFVFQRRERRLEQMRGKGGGCVLVCWLLRGRRKSKGRGGRPM